jgi:hypothetical protein
MTHHSLSVRVLRYVGYLALDLLEALVDLAAVGLLTIALDLVLPFAVALVASLLVVCTVHGYLIARRIDRARQRGEAR